MTAAAPGKHIDIVFSKIDAGLEQRNQPDQFFFDGLDAQRQRTVQLLRRDPGLVESLRGNQVLHGFCLGKVDTAAEKGALGELARCCQARPTLDRLAHHRLQNDRRTVSRNLQHIFAGVGIGSGEESHHRLI